MSAVAQSERNETELQFPPASGPRIAFAPPENRVAEGVIGNGGGGARSGSGGNDAVHGGVDNKMGGLY